MASDTPASDNAQAGDAGDATDGGQKQELAIHSQYVKDLSFENPRAPASVAPGSEQPHGDIAIQVKSRNVGEDRYEVLIEFHIEAKTGDDVAFIVELSYGGVFTLRGFDDDTRRLALWVECPRILFPFARRIIADSVRDGGFTPLMLGPIDFLQLYQQRSSEAAAPPRADA